MILRKVSIGDRDLQKKYRIQTNTSVSYWFEEFDCNGHVARLSYGKEKAKKNIGISKCEAHISDRYRVNGYKGNVEGG